METGIRKKNTWLNTGKQMGLALLTLVVLLGVIVLVFMRFYDQYDGELLYAERLNQMQEVTGQLFSGLEDIVNVQWEKARVQCNYLKDEDPETVDEMVAFMRRQDTLNEMQRGSEVIAFDTQGRYYTKDGKRGLIAGMEYLEDDPEQVSYVFNEMTTTLTQMLFLYRLDEPRVLRDGDQTAEIFYYGLALNMEILNPYFVCDAYGGNNSTYVVDAQGLKLFSGNNNTDLLKGFNVFSVLRDMEYLHDSSFDDTLQTMQQDGAAYSNAILEQEEYYYSLYQMDNSEWILLFLVPSRYVAVNTVQLVNTTTKLLMSFSVLMTLVCAVVIYIILRIQQQKALQIANETNALLKANNEKLEQAQLETGKALKVAEAASKAKSDFLANMSHDIRTPMNAIVGITKLMAHDKRDPAKIDSYIEKVQQSSQHLLSLINDVLDMSKIESGEVVLNRESISLADQLAQVESIIRPQIEEHKQHLAVRTRSITHEYLVGDAVRLRQILLNLMSNAVKYTPSGGQIALDLEELPCEKAGYAKIRIAVADNGYGMTPEFMAHIFEPFTRAENSTTNRVQGTGLGMAITKNIVDMAGGSISVQSEVDRGSCFTVELCLRIDTEVKTELPVHTILLITDDDRFVENAQAGFENTDAALLIARTEAEADALLRQNHVEAVLLGSSLNGDTLENNVQRLRKNAGGAILLYCCDYEEREHLPAIAENGGVDGVLTRPFFLSNFVSAIERFCSSSAPAAEEESSSILHGKHFLCAEDNALNAEILQAVMDMNGASCVIYPDGQKLVEAFASVKPGEYDAILMDVQMPVMNGLDATRAIRHGDNPLGRSIPIIAMTANAFSEDVQNCLDAGMDAHVSKPLDIGALERTLRSVTGGKFSGGGTIVRLPEA